MPREIGDDFPYQRRDIQIQRDAAGIGTAGCILRGRSDGKLYLLSAAHVMAWNVDRPPSPQDPISIFDTDGNRRQIATLVDWAPRLDEAEPHRMDAAIAILSDQSDPAIDLIGRPKKKSSFFSPGDRVTMTGAHSGTTWSQISEDAVSLATTYHRGDQAEFSMTLMPLVKCNAAASAPFTRGGDSGAAVYNDRGALIGLVVGGDASYSLFCCIDYIFERFDLMLP
jgi:hypothetical protein